MFRRINIYSITKHYSLDDKRNDIENLVNYIEQQVDSHSSNQSRRFAEMWYDLLYNCSSVRRRSSLDITSLMIHLEGMLYYLLNNSKASSISCQKYINEIRTFLGLGTETKTYLNGYEPLDVRPGSNYAYFLVAQLVKYYLKKNSTATVDDIKNRRENLPPYLIRYDILNYCESKTNGANINYSSVQDIYSKTSSNLGDFALLIHLLHKLYMSDESTTYNNIKESLIKYRNSVDHDGVIGIATTSNAASKNDSGLTHNIIKYILLLASKVCPNVTRNDNTRRSSRDITERLTDFFSSGTLLKKTTTSIDKVEEFSRIFGKKSIAITIIVAIVGLLGYYMYLNIDRRTIDFSSVPKTKRIELFDKIITGRETEEDMRHMQRDIRNFDSIKTYVNDYEEH